MRVRSEVGGDFSLEYTLCRAQCVMTDQASLRKLVLIGVGNFCIFSLMVISNLKNLYRLMAKMRVVVCAVWSVHSNCEELQFIETDVL